jgi:hypothetical protein
MNTKKKAIKYITEKLKDKPDILAKSILAGFLLESAGSSDNEIIAGYLSFVIDENSDFIGEIISFFGGEISSLVLTSKRIAGEMSIEERMKQNNKNIIGLPDKNKDVLCAKIIAYLEYDKDKKGSDEFLKDIDAPLDKKMTLLNGMFNHLAIDYASSLISMLYSLLNEMMIADYSFSYEENFVPSDLRAELNHLRNALLSNKPYLIILTNGKFSSSNSFSDVLLKLFDVKYRLKVDDREENLSFDDIKESLSLVEKNLLISASLKGNVLERLIGDDSVILGSDYLVEFFDFVTMLIKEKIISLEDIKNFARKNQRIIESAVNIVFVNYAANKELDLEDSNTSEYENLLENCKKLIVSDVKDVDITKITSREETVIITGMLLPYMDKSRILALRESIIK